MIQSKPETVRLYIVEEQEIYREMYNYILPVRTNIEILRISENREMGVMAQEVSELSPAVLLLSVKKLDINIIEELEQIRNNYPQMGIVILIVFYSSQDVELLRRLALCGESGMALQLTTRELEILSLLSQGYTNSAIAETLFIDIKTVEHHLNSMYSKLKADPDYNAKHLRVSAARLYLETMGTLYQREEAVVHAGGR